MVFTLHGCRKNAREEHTKGGIIETIVKLYRPFNYSGKKSRKLAPLRVGLLLNLH